MELTELFQKAQEKSKTLPSQPPNVLLDLYSLFKQATAGDVSGERPSMFDLKGRAKYDAWEAKKGMSNQEAMSAYVALVDSLG